MITKQLKKKYQSASKACEKDQHGRNDERSLVWLPGEYTTNRSAGSSGYLYLFLAAVLFPHWEYESDYISQMYTFILLPCSLPGFLGVLVTP